MRRQELKTKWTERLERVRKTGSPGFASLDWKHRMLLRRGSQARDEDVARRRHEHINMLGRYTFTLPDQVARGKISCYSDPKVRETGQSMDVEVELAEMLWRDRASTLFASDHADDDRGHKTKGHGDRQDLQSSLEFHPALLLSLGGKLGTLVGLRRG